MASRIKNRILKSIEQLDKKINELGTNIGPSHHPLFFERSKLYFKIRKYEESLKDIEKAIEFHSETADYFYHRGNLFRELQHLDQSLREYFKAISLNKDFAHAYNAIGIIYFQMESPIRAIDFYDEAIDKNPDFSEAYDNRAVVKYEYDGDKLGALRDFKKAIECDKDNCIAYNHRALLWLDQKEYEKAMKDVSKALEINPKFQDAHNTFWIIKTRLRTSVKDTRTVYSVYENVSRIVEEDLGGLRSEIAEDRKRKRIVIETEVMDETAPAKKKQKID